MIQIKPTVTELLDILNKPALLKWANKIGLEGKSIDKVREEAFKNGNRIHKQIEEYIKNGIQFEDGLIQKNFGILFNDKEILESEKNIETDYFIGRYDIKFEFKGKIFLGDFKTSKGVWDENILQLAAYRMAEPADGIAVIKVPEFKIRYINITNFIPYEEILKRLSQIYYLRKNLPIINPYHD